MRRGVIRRSADSVPLAVLSLRDHLFDLRRGGDLSRAVRGRIHRAASRRVHRDPRLPPPAHRRTRLGLGQRLFKLGAMSEVAVDEGLRSELQKQGIWVTSLNEVYNWGRRNSIWPLQFGLACCA